MGKIQTGIPGIYLPVRQDYLIRDILCTWYFVPWTLSPGPWTPNYLVQVVVLPMNEKPMNPLSFSWCGDTSVILPL